MRREDLAEGVTLYCGDMIEILPTLGTFEAIITDPPYVGLKGNFEHFQTNNLGPSYVVTKGVGDPWAASFDWLSLAKAAANRAVIAFCGYSDVALLKNAADLDGWLVTWAFENSAPSVRNAPWFRNEFAWVLKTGRATWRKIPTVIFHPKLNAGCAGSPERILNIDGTAAHPTQKPVAVINQLICPEFETICDPFMGTASTGIAAIRRGKQFTGIERERKYFDIACRRISDELSRPRLDLTPAPKPVQERLPI